jgi:ribonuclease E
MSTPDKKSHWASLANVLGAKVPQEPRQPATAAPVPSAVEPTPPPTPEPEPVPTPVAPVAETPVAPPAAKAPGKAKRDNWGKVLGALGLRAPDPEPEPEVEVPAPPPTPAPALVTPAPTQAILPPSNPLPKNLWELLGDKTPEPTVDRVETEIFAGEVGGNDLMLGEDEEADEEHGINGWFPPRAAEPVKPVGEFDRPRRRDEEETGDRPRRRRRRRRRRGEAGVESTETRAPADDYPETVAASRYHDDGDDEEPIDEEFAPPVESYDADEIDAPPSRRAEPAGDEERPRRRRRRRRGRGRSSETAAPAPTAETPRSARLADRDDDEDDDLADDEEFVPAPPPRRESSRNAAPRGRRPEPAPARVVADSDIDDEDEDVVDHGEHRSIPTWQDAIGIVVGTNMEARAKNPNGARAGRGRGGRGRGGRGR